MDIYARKSKWKWYLGIAGGIVLIISAIYTSYLANQLGKGEETKVELFVNAITELSKTQEETFNSDTENVSDDFFTEDLTEVLNTVKLLDNVPVILVSETGQIDSGRNFGDEKDYDLDFLAKELEKIKKSGKAPISGPGGYADKIYYKNTQLLTLLQYFPLLQFLLIAGFIAFGYLGFSSSRRAEQNQVWVGMAKETAHQLGTPISAIIGWIDHLKEMYGGDEYMMDVVGELKKDTSRLELIADRFSKIGSEPKMQSINIYDELENMRAYMQRRASRKIEFDFPESANATKMVQINPPLFNWVLENLLRNALDAMGGKGKISAKVYEEKDHVCVDISDTGKGIPSSKFKTVFKPGYSTKKRGWGLGLSLAKRIIETYHSGKIFVSKSLPNEQTTFTIKLPVNHYVRGENSLQSLA
ncbi:MAG: HAMP domain-containing sensor histidine kinase [Bacteroidota bacterium]